MIFYDFEVFEKDWLAVFIDVTKKKEHVIINSPDKLKALYEANRKDIWVGFNNRHYDQYIMKGILLGMNPKKINDWIIVDNKEGWQYSRAFNKLPMINYDVMPSNDETMKTVGLKTMEGFLGSNIKETDVDFRIKRKLTQEEIEQTVKYCRHDVEQTIKVFLEKVSEFNAALVSSFIAPESAFSIFLYGNCAFFHCFASAFLPALAAATCFFFIAFLVSYTSLKLLLVAALVTSPHAISIDG